MGMLCVVSQVNVSQCTLITLLLRYMECFHILLQFLSLFCIRGALINDLMMINEESSGFSLLVGQKKQSEGVWFELNRTFN